MNWKESVKYFFKPTKLKIILFVLMAVVSTYLGFSGSCIAGCAVSPEVNAHVNPLDCCNWQYKLSKSIFPVLAPPFVIFYGSLWPALIGGIFYWWIVSCVIGIIIEKAGSKVRE